MELLAATSTAEHGEARALIITGLFLLAGFAAHILGRRVHVPRVTLLLLMGFLASPSVLELIPENASHWFPLAARIALSIVGFQLGERFLGKNLRKTGTTVLAVSLAEVTGAAAMVFIVLRLCGFSLPLSLLLAAVAPASAPAATLDVIREAKSRGPLTNTVLGIVAIDDAWGVMLFSVLLVVAQAITGQDASGMILVHGLWEVAGGLLLGALIGLPMAWLTGRVRPGELTLIEALGFVFLCSGAAIRFELSHILACMAMGATVSNMAKHHERPFHAMEEVEQPFLIVFFLLAGFDFDAKQLATVGIVGIVYVLARSLGKIGGSYVGGWICGAPRSVRGHAGWCLLPQAGVALGLALIAQQRYPELGAQVLSIIVATTIIFELAGPLITRFALHHAGEVPSDASSGSAESASQGEDREGGRGVAGE
ncbi:MAG: cation:proton antiporter [Pirellulaceae bacterium]